MHHETQQTTYRSNAAPPDPAYRAKYGRIPRTAWVVLGLGALFLVAAMKLLTVDQAVDVVTVPLVTAGAAGAPRDA
jgi:hypothetical protein